MTHTVRVILVTIIGIVALIDSALARVGETTQQCQQRYGEPIKSDANSMSFKKGGWFLMINFHQGKADSVLYRKAEENALGKGEKISDNEIEQLLKLNGGERGWKKADAISMDREWQTEDSEFYAHYGTLDHFLIIATKGWLDRQKAARKAKEDKGLNGF